MKKQKIAITVQTEVQLFSVKPLFSKLDSRGYILHIIIDDMIGNIDSGFNELPKKLFKNIKEQGYNPKYASTLTSRDIYDIWLTPYVEPYTRAKCVLKYEYGTLNIKPNLTYTIELMGKFDGFLCNSTVTANLLSAYGKTFLADNLRFFELKSEKRKHNKEIILFAPTYNDNETTEDITNVVLELKKKYEVWIKGHHGTQYRTDKKAEKDTLIELADRYFDSMVPISELMMKVDVCLTGNSSVLGEALYSKTPCAIFAKDLDFFRLNNLHTTQYKLVNDGIILSCDNADDINDTIEKTLLPESIKKQSEYSNEIFPPELRTGTDGYIKTIEYFLFNKEAGEYLEIQRYKKEAVRNIILDNKNKDYIIEGYRKGKLYKISQKVYDLKRKIKNE